MHDRDYYDRRVRAELAMAQIATVPEAAMAHNQLAALYLALAAAVCAEPEPPGPIT